MTLYRPSKIENRRPPLMLYVATAALAVLFSEHSAQGQETDSPMPSAEVPVEQLQVSKTYTVEADGRYIYEAEHTVLVRNEEGVHRSAQIGFSYSESRETFDVLEAYTETPDGKRIDVPADKIMTKESPGTANASMFADVKVKIIIFPDVEVRSKLHYKTRLTVKEPPYTGYFTIEDFLNPHVLDDAYTVTVYAANTVKLNRDVVGFQGGVIPCPTEQAGRTCYRWSARNTVFVPPENGSVSSSDYGQHVILSNLPSYEAIATAYWERAADKVKVSPPIQALADDLTRGMSGERAEAEALYDWVARNIRYVAIVVGAGSVVPHAADQVLDNRYGDCKDHVTLLQSLLAAKHIKSVGVLVGANSRWTLPSAPDTHIFNHIITYIPSLNLYVDSTSAFSRFGQLPESEVGKPGLKVQSVQGTRQLEPIVSASSEGHTTTNIVMELREDGSASGSAESQVGGGLEMALRAAFAALPPGQGDSIAQSTLAKNHESGTGSFTTTDPRDLSKSFAYQTTFSIPGLITIPGPGAFPVPTGLRFARLADLGQAASLPTRKYPWICGIPGSRTETTHLTLPASVRVTNTPKDVHLKNGFGSYDAHYDASGSTITVTREFAHLFAGDPCNDDNYQQFRELTAAIERDVKAQFLYE